MLTEAPMLPILRLSKQRLRIMPHPAVMMTTPVQEAMQQELTDFTATLEISITTVDLIPAIKADLTLD